MKTRNGLVSNSSSTSFCLYGWAGRPKEVFKLLEQTEKGRSCLKERVEDFNGDMETLKESDWALDGIFESGEGGYDYGYLYIGFPPTSLKDDETGAEFKARVRAYVSEWVGEEAAQKCSWHVEGWYEG